MNIREQRAAERAKKRKRQKVLSFGIGLAAILIIVLISVSIFLDKNTLEVLEQTTYQIEDVTENPEALAARSSLAAASLNLEEAMFSKTNIDKTLTETMGKGLRYAFISVSDGESRAKVFHAAGTSAKEAYTAAYDITVDYVYTNCLNPKYVRVDFVKNIDVVKTPEVASAVSDESAWYGQFYRHGIAFDREFNVALLENELNANAIIDYDDDKDIQLAYLNKYLTANNYDEFKSLPDEIFAFDTIGFIYDATGVYELISDDSTSNGRRVFELNAESAKAIAGEIYAYLFTNMESNGKFVYGLFPIDGANIGSYDIEKHAYTVDALINYANVNDMAGMHDEDIKIAIDYLIGNIVSKDDATMFVVDDKANIASAVATARTCSALISYSKRSADTSFDSTIDKLSNGLLFALDAGEIICNQNFYYGSTDGEDFAVANIEHSTAGDCVILSALCDIYGYTNDEIILSSAKHLADKMIADDYQENYNPEIINAFNKLTKYCDDEKYFSFPLLAVADGLDTVKNRLPVYANYTEALICAYEIYLRIDEKALTIDALADFDLEKFLSVLNIRAEKLADGYAYPETAMYMKNPADVLGAFMSRAEKFRVRIDDNAQYINALLKYAENYTNIEADLIAINSPEPTEPTVTEEADE